MPLPPLDLVVAPGTRALSTAASGQLGSLLMQALAVLPISRSTAVSWLSSSGGTTPSPTALMLSASVSRYGCSAAPAPSDLSAPVSGASWVPVGVASGESVLARV